MKEKFRGEAKPFKIQHMCPTFCVHLSTSSRSGDGVAGKVERGWGKGAYQWAGLVALPTYCLFVRFIANKSEFICNNKRIKMFNKYLHSQRSPPPESRQHLLHGVACYLYVCVSECIWPLGRRNNSGRLSRNIRLDIFTLNDAT